MILLVQNSVCMAGQGWDASVSASGYQAATRFREEAGRLYVHGALGNNAWWVQQQTDLRRRIIGVRTHDDLD